MTRGKEKLPTFQLIRVCMCAHTIQSAKNTVTIGGRGWKKIYKSTSRYMWLRLSIIQFLHITRCGWHCVCTLPVYFAVTSSFWAAVINQVCALHHPSAICPVLPTPLLQTLDDEIRLYGLRFRCTITDFVVGFFFAAFVLSAGFEFNLELRGRGITHGVN